MFGFSSLRCNDCENLDKYDRNEYGEAYCPVDRKYVSLDSYTCRDFQANFYIITAYSIINKLPFNGEVMTKLLGVRNTYMRNNTEGQEFLEEYDNIGPILAEDLMKDMYRYDVVKELENDYINPMLMFINENRFEDVQNTFISMIDKLKIRYGYVERIDNIKTKRL